MKQIILFITLFATLMQSSTLQLSISSSPSRINPLLATDSASSEISNWIFNGLVKFDKDGEIIGDLAKKFYFENNTTLIFELKEGVKWHDGEIFDAEDVLYTFNLLHSPKLLTPYKDDFKYIKSVKIINPYKIKVVYKEAYFKALSIWMMGILPEHLWKNEKNPMTSKLNKMPIGTGAYMLKKAFKVNEKIILEANPYYLPHKPNIDTIKYNYIGDASTEFIILKAKKLDIGSLNPLQINRQLNSDFKSYYNIIEQPSQSYTYMGFNLRKDKFKNKKIREAINYAIDKQKLIDLLFFSHGKICNGPFMPNSPVYPDDYKPNSYNPEKAKKILKELGFSKNNPFKFELITNTGNDIRINASQIIQYQLAKVGIKMSIRTMEWQSFLNTVVMPHQFEAVLMGWSLSLIPDAYSIWHSDGDKQGGFNFIGYKNKQVDNLIIKSQKIINSQKFAKEYQKIFKLIADDIPYIFLYIPNSITVVNKKIEGIKPSLIGIMHNSTDWIKE
ncbi:Oligopeptide ABC transporter, periplasmic oligopeptide-binding protein OppA (TC 3.A.1.5.1) [hydrothermal vent metagenome]|uniref:Oligopeptide ABC transporter, periplasmic oligopeptide-binding protein OppA (TC 3.A.1.5.1) n=1 Tax=hydrothermal vent metagenome TaxID=652676 RepID=A0A1W1CBS1_9ZZZZ